MRPRRTAYGCVSPRAIAAMVTWVEGRKRFWFAVVVRMMFGALLIYVAPACRYPMVVRILGGFAIVAALIILAAGRQPLDETINWWLTNLLRVRVSALFAMAMGVLLIYIAK